MRNKRKITYQGRRKRMPARDAFSNPMARLGAGTPNLLDSTYYPMQRLTRNYQLLNSLYREHWIMRRIIDVIPSDMLKNWITITTEVDPELLKRVDLELRRTQLIEKIKHGLKWGRLYGGAIGIMVIKGQGNNLSEPLDTERMVPGDFCGLLIFDRWNGVEPSMTLVDDITDPEYGMPAYYTVTDTVSGKSVSVHYSRVVRFVGDELPFWEGQSEQLWGASVIESVFEELKKRDNVSWNIAQLTFMASLRVLKMNDLGQMLAASDEASQKELYNTIQAQNWLMSNMGLQVIDAADGIESHQYTFGGLSEVYQQFMMDISGAAQIPATKLFGRSPSGMNATGESDLQNYYEMIGQEQESKLRPILNKILPVLCMSVFGAVPDDLDFDFDPVSEPSDQERSDLAKSGTENVVAALNAGLVSKRTALKELKQQSERTGVWTNITDQDIMNASDEIEEEGEMGGMPGIPDFQGEEVEETEKNAGDFSGNSDFKPKSDNLPEEEERTPEKAKLTQDSDFEESKHPRDKDGKFSSGNGKAVRRRYKNKVVKLSKREYATVIHELNTNLSKEERKQKNLYKCIGSYLYTVKNNGFNNYQVLGKIEID